MSFFLSPRVGESAESWAGAAAARRAHVFQLLLRRRNETHWALVPRFLSSFFFVHVKFLIRSREFVRYDLIPPRGGGVRGGGGKQVGLTNFTIRAFLFYSTSYLQIIRFRCINLTRSIFDDPPAELTVNFILQIYSFEKRPSSFLPFFISF